MIEEEEKIVFYLEELDNNFSRINRTLKEIEEKIEKIYKLNIKVVDDYKPFINMFRPKKKEENGFENFNSSIIMKSNSPKDPFTDNTEYYEKSNIFEKSNILEKSNINEKDSSSSALTEVKIYSDCYVDESSSSEIHEFDIDKVPAIFRGEEDFFTIYNYILESKKVKFEDIIDNFSNVDYDKICVYLEVLRNKKFIKKKGSKFYIE